MKPLKHKGVAIAIVLVILLSGLTQFQVDARQDSSDVAPVSDVVVCEVCEYSSLVEALDQAPDGAVIEVRGGVYDGGLVITKPVVLRGIDQPVIDGGGAGTIVWIEAPDVTIDGFILRGTGTSHDKEDSAITVESPRATISNNLIEEALFGIYLRESHDTVVRDNTIVSLNVDQPLRGDGIKVWYSHDILVENNTATDGRDMILWYSDRARMIGNQFDRNRYGMHLMYSNDVFIQGNSLNYNAVGLYIMYSVNSRVIGNSMSNNHGASGGGLGFKDVDNAVVEGNRFVNNQIGVQLDNSPREKDAHNYITGNVFAFNEIGLGVQPAIRANTLTDNSFVDNGEHVAVLGRGQVTNVNWAADGSGNYWSDYAGYDEGGDGVGDLPYESEQLFESLVSNYPDLRLFAYSPASMAIDFAAEALPAFRPEVKFEDPAPLMSPPMSTLLPEADEPDQARRIALGLIAGAAFLVAIGLAWTMRKRRTWNLAVSQGEAQT